MTRRICLGPAGDDSFFNPDRPDPRRYEWKTIITDEVEFQRPVIKVKCEFDYFEHSTEAEEGNIWTGNVTCSFEDILPLRPTKEALEVKTGSEYGDIRETVSLMFPYGAEFATTPADVARVLTQEYWENEYDDEEAPQSYPRYPSNRWIPLEELHRDLVPKKQEFVTKFVIRKLKRRFNSPVIWEAVKNMKEVTIEGEELPMKGGDPDIILYFKREAILNVRYQIRKLFGDMPWVRVNKERTKIIGGPF